MVVDQLTTETVAAVGEESELVVGHGLAALDRQMWLDSEAESDVREVRAAGGDLSSRPDRGVGRGASDPWW